MWGIGAKAPNRQSLAPGDLILIYVGAPEYELIGHAELGSPVHEWTPQEMTQYPGGFESGVVFSQAETWPHPVSMKSVLPQLALKQTNPGARFFSGVIRITKEDYETVVAVGTGKLPPSKSTEHAAVPPVSPPAKVTPPDDGAARPIDVDLLFKTAEKLEPAAKLGGSLSEYDTRAEFIDKYLEALGYTEFGDIQRGSPVDSATSPTTSCALTASQRSRSRPRSSAPRSDRKRPARWSVIARTSASAGAPSPTDPSSNSTTRRCWAYRPKSDECYRSTLPTTKTAKTLRHVSIPSSS
jgi:hypothetical protein